MEPVIQTHHLGKIYHSGNVSIKAVDEVSITVNRGEFAALVGPSGSGKTTMLAMLAALLTPSAGEICVNGQDLSRFKERERVAFRRREIGFTFQSNNLIPFLTVLENVEFMLRLNKNFDKVGRQRALDLLERLGLENRLGSLPRQLSGGERQRVAIARSMIHEPSVVLADEPTANLDTERAYQVVKTYADMIHEQNKAGIMVTHDLRMSCYVDKILRIKDGRITSVIDSQPEIQAIAGCA
jgi:putative ABC transport system ATP-binding protein